MGPPGSPALHRAAPTAVGPALSPALSTAGRARAEQARVVHGGRVVRATRPRFASTGGLRPGPQGCGRYPETTGEQAAVRPLTVAAESGVLPGRHEWCGAARRLPRTAR